MITLDDIKANAPYGVTHYKDGKYYILFVGKSVVKATSYESYVWGGGLWKSLSGFYEFDKSFIELKYSKGFDNWKERPAPNQSIL